MLHRMDEFLPKCIIIHDIFISYSYDRPFKSDMIQSKDKKSQNIMDLLNHSIGNRIRNSLSDSKEADELEKDYLEQLFKSNLALKNIFNEITSEPFIKMKYINGFLISIDASKREGNCITGYHPWRMNKIVDYCFNFEKRIVRNIPFFMNYKMKILF